MPAIDFVEHTRNIWQPYYEHTLTPQDALDIVSNWAAYITVISDWLIAKQGINHEELNHYDQ